MSIFLKKIAEAKLKNKEKETSGIWNSKLVIEHYQKVANLEDDLFRLPTPEEFFFLQTDKAFNAFTFIPFIAKHHPIKELYATTYSISRRTIEALIEMHDKGIIEQITLLISDSMIKRNPVTIDNLMAMQSSRANLKVLYAWSHAKVACIKTHEEYFVVEGSGNWSENAHYEQYVLANSKGLYDFRLQLFTNTNLKKY